VAITQRDYSWISDILSDGNSKEIINDLHLFYMSRSGVRMPNANGELRPTHRMDAFGLATGVMLDPIICRLLVERGADIHVPRSFDVLESTSAMVTHSTLMAKSKAASDDSKRDSKAHNIIEWLETCRGRLFKQYRDQKATSPDKNPRHPNLVRITQLENMIRYLCSAGQASTVYLRPQFYRPWAFSGILDRHEIVQCLGACIRGQVHSALKWQFYGDDVKWTWSKRDDKEIEHIRNVSARWSIVVSTVEQRISDMVLSYEVRTVESEHPVHTAILNAMRAPEFLNPHPKCEIAENDDGSSFLGVAAQEIKTKPMLSAPIIKKKKARRAHSAKYEASLATADESEDIAKSGMFDNKPQDVVEAEEKYRLSWRQALKTRLLAIEKSVDEHDELSAIADKLKVRDDAGDMDTRADSGGVSTFPFTEHEMFTLPVRAAAAAPPPPPVSLSSVAAAPPPRAPTKLSSLASAAPPPPPRRTTRSTRGPGVGLKIPS
jgi:hypothetical protein